MAILPFKHYLHDGYGPRELVDSIQKQTGIELTDEQIEIMGQPFYEVTLHCLIDTETGYVEIAGVE